MHASKSITARTSPARERALAAAWRRGARRRRTPKRQWKPAGEMGAHERAAW